MPAPTGFDHVSTTKSSSTRSIAAHPRKKRKDGAPSVGMTHAKIVKGGPPAYVASNTMTSHQWQPSVFLSGDIAEKITKIKGGVLDEISLIHRLRS